MILLGLLFLVWAYQNFGYFPPSRVDTLKVSDPIDYNQIGTSINDKRAEPSESSTINVYTNKKKLSNSEVGFPFKELLLMGLVGLFWSIRKEKTNNTENHSSEIFNENHLINPNFPMTVLTIKKEISHPDFLF